MITYFVGLFIATVAWIIVTVGMIVDAHDWPSNREKARRAQKALLTGFLLPVYPAVVCVGAVLVPIWLYRRLGRLGEKKEKE